MKAGYDPERHHRRSIRLKGYDYAQSGAYFVTICVHDRSCVFGDIENGAMRLSDAGREIQAVLEGLPDHYPHVELDAWVIMPNHVHGIMVLWNPLRAASESSDVQIADVVGAGFKPAPTPRGTIFPTQRTATVTRHSLPEIVRAFKTFSSRRVNELRGTPGTPLWQRNYYEHIIRNEDALNRIREYIANNPARWAEDRLHPSSDWSSETRR